MAITAKLPTADTTLPYFCTPNEAADLLRVSRRWIYNRLRTGELQAAGRIHAGTRAPIRIKTDDVFELLREPEEMVA